MSKAEIKKIAAEKGFKVADNSPKRSHRETWDLLDKSKTHKPYKTVDNLALILENDPAYQTLCYDEHADRILWKGERLESKHTMQIRRDIETRYRLSRPTKEIKDTVMMVAHDKIVEPIKDWLRSLKWDGEERLTNILEDVFQAKTTDSNRDVIQAMSRSWFLSAVARILQPGCAAQSMLVLAGAKNLGKSWSLQILASKKWFSRSPLDITGKKGQELIHQSGIWIWELAEMKDLTGKHADVGKAFLTEEEDLYRPAYGHFPVIRKRRVIFAGSTNNFQFLSDGADRRFYPITCTRPIDCKYLQEHREQIWAEAVHAYDQGESWFLSYKMADRLYAYQQAYMIDDPWAIDIMECAAECHTEKLTTKKILEYLSIPIHQRNMGTFKRIAQIMRDCGFEQKEEYSKTTKNTIRYWVNAADAARK